jgi:hypothetical protein
MADGRFGCEADMAGPATGSTRSLVTYGSPRFYTAKTHRGHRGRLAPLQAMSPGPGRLARLRSVGRDARRVVCSCGLRYSSFIRLAPFGLPQPVTASYPAAAL